MRNINFFLLALLGAATCCVAFQRGAPLEACESLLPGHGTNPQQTSAPFVVTAEDIGDNKIKVKIFSPSHDEFKGFMLQARSANNRAKFIAGEFETDAKSKGISCEGHEKSTITHVNNEPKTEITTEWTGTAAEGIIFRATVVKSYSEFWTNIDSKPVETDELTTGQNSEEDVYDGCLKEKGCLGMPKDCVKNKECKILLTYKGLEDGKFAFELHGNLKASEYMAMGLSEDATMGDDFVTACVRVGQNDPKLRRSWNQGQRNIDSVDESEEKYDSRIVDRLSSCSWKDENVIHFKDKSVDLNTDKIHILLAHGPVLRNGDISYHRAKLSTSEPVSFSGPVWEVHTVYSSIPETTDVTTEKQPTFEISGNETFVSDEHSSCSQLKFDLFWFALFGVIYAGGRNALSLV